MPLGPPEQSFVDIAHQALEPLARELDSTISLVGK